MAKFRHPATGTGAVSLTVNPEKEWQLEEVRIHLNAVGGAGNLTITIDSNAGAAYDVVILTQDMTAVTDLVYQPTRPHNFVNGDKIVIAWANGGGKTWGLEVVYS